MSSIMKKLILVMCCLFVFGSAFTSLATAEQESSLGATELEDGITVDTDEFTGVASENEAVSAFESKFSMAGIYEDMKTAISNGEDFTLAEIMADNSFGDYLSNGSALHDVDVTGMAELVTGNMAVINTNYNNIINNLTDTYYSNELSTTDCLTLFSQTYSGVDLSLAEYSIPDSFAVDSLLSSASANINSMYQSAISSNDFAGIKNQISISSIFETAENVRENGMEMPRLLGEVQLTHIRDNALGASETGMRLEKEKIDDAMLENLQNTIANANAYEIMLEETEKTFVEDKNDTASGKTPTHDNLPEGDVTGILYYREGGNYKAFEGDPENTDEQLYYYDTLSGSRGSFKPYN